MKLHSILDCKLTRNQTQGSKLFLGRWFLVAFHANVSINCRVRTQPLRYESARSDQHVSFYHSEETQYDLKYAKMIKVL